MSAETDNLQMTSDDSDKLTLENVPYTLSTVNEPHIESNSSSENVPHIENNPSSENEPQIEINPSSEYEPQIEINPSSENEPHTDNNPFLENQPHIENNTSSENVPGTVSNSSEYTMDTSNNPTLQNITHSVNDPSSSNAHSSSNAPHTKINSSRKTSQSPQDSTLVNIIDLLNQSFSKNVSKTVNTSFKKKPSTVKKTVPSNTHKAVRKPLSRYSPPTEYNPGSGTFTPRKSPHDVMTLKKLDAIVTHPLYSPPTTPEPGQLWSEVKLQLLRLPSHWEQHDVSEYIRVHTQRNKEIHKAIKSIAMIKQMTKLNESEGKAIVTFTDKELCRHGRNMLKKVKTSFNGVRIWCKPAFHEDSEEIEKDNTSKKDAPNQNVPSIQNNKNNKVKLDSTKNQGKSLNKKMVLSNECNNSSETYGLHKAFLDSLGIKLPLKSMVFVIHLPQEYLDNSDLIGKLFSHAGNVVSYAVGKRIDSKYFASVRFDHPVEAVQAIAMFHNQEIYGKKIKVNMDNCSDININLHMPAGLKSFGSGLGEGGIPLQNVRYTIELKNVLDTLTNKLEEVKIENSRKQFNDSAGTRSEGASSQPQPNPFAAPASSQSNAANSPLLALSALFNPQTIQMLQMVTQQNAANNLLSAPTPQPHITSQPQITPQPQTSVWNTPQPAQNVPYQNLSWPNMPGQIIQGQGLQGLGTQVQNVQGQNVPGQNIMDQYNQAQNMLGQNMQGQNVSLATVPGQILQGLILKGQSMQEQNILAQNMLNPNILAQNIQGQNVPGHIKQGQKAQGHSMQGHNVQRYNAAEQDKTRKMMQELRQSASKTKEVPVSRPLSPVRTNSRGDAKKRRLNDNCTVLFNYLPPSVTASALHTKMSEVGSVRSSELTGPGRARVTFYSPKDAEDCIDLLDRTKVDGQKIEVKFA